MATIIPFRGIRYNPHKIEKLDLVVTQPYDKITGDMQEEYYGKHPLNIVRVHKGKSFPGDSSTSNVYTRAADFFDQWERGQILVQDKEPSIYPYDQEYTTLRGEKRVRKGLITALRLEEFTSGVVLPHERTLSKPKEDRLKLLKATGVYFGQIFILYPDPQKRVDQLLKSFKLGAPCMEARDEYGVIHRVWCISEERTIQKAREEMRDKSLVIADGHHRYETALDYRNWVREHRGGGTGDEPWQYVMVTLVSMEDEGLTILPTHRLIHSLEGFDLKRFIKDSNEFFNIEKVGTKEKLFGEMERRGTSEHLFGIYGGRGEYHLMALRDERVIDDFVEKSRAPEWKTLDVTICHSIIIEHLLGISKERVIAQENISYAREPEEGIKGVDSRKCQLAIFLNPTRMSQVRAVAQKGEAMPQKSTDFYPKLLSGLVMFRVTE